MTEMPEIKCDTPTQSSVFEFQKPRVPFMAIQRRAAGGRPSKGDRHVLTTRLPIADAEKLFAVADALGTSASSFIAEVMAEKLAHMDLDKLSSQEALPLTKAS